MNGFESKSPSFWVVAVVAALGLVLAVQASRTPAGRLSNLALPGDFPHVYVQFKVDDPTRCLVTDRDGSTADRAEGGLMPARWYCTRSGEHDEGLLTLDGERVSSLFVPYEKVADPVFPLLYEQLHQAAGEPPLPRLRWVHLFVDRTYRGFYLQATLPTREFGGAQELGELEMLVVAENRLHCFDRKLRSLCPIYTGLVAESIFPKPNYPPGAGRLAALLPPDLPRAFVLSDKGAESLRPWPLPFSLPEMVRSQGGTPYFDQRLQTWRPAENVAEGVAEGVAEAAAGPALGQGLDRGEVARILHEALAASCAVRRCDAAALGARIEGSRSLAAIGGTP